MILARYILAIQKGDAKPCVQNTLHLTSNDGTHLTHTNKQRCENDNKHTHIHMHVHTQREFSQTKHHLDIFLH